MPISPIKTYAALSDAGAGIKRDPNPGSSFQSFLERIQPGTGDTKAQNERAAAELLRLEMMQSSLSLGFGDQQAEPFANRMIPDILSRLVPAGSGGFEGFRQGTREATGKSGASAGNPATETTPQLDGIEESAARFIGTPYLFGGESGSGIDCSSFVQKVFQEHQISLPRTAREQIQLGTDVATSELRKGDLVFFRTYASYPSHVGIYLGDGKMIHASSGKGEVTISDLNSEYYRSRYIGAKRVT